ncbi:alpha/beta hydrolase family protein [Dietzia aerolata]|uniref:alpha/beta hydrolase family protein n=1 Tax=Dietzia aerolata TaxID=595984 RepID=UPI00363F3592
MIAALLRGSQIPEQVFPDAVLDGDLGATLRENSPTGPWPAPVLVAQGLADPLVKPSMQQSWVDGRCAAGEPIDYRTYPGLDHMGLVAADSPLTPQLVEWTLARWSGQAPTPTC